jgi:uroporphyrin-III C-methyltransferase/precorrin-2 dehydrogenase/sirohydrochlorin ferrochelatase
MRHFPIFLDLAGRTALLLGTGEAAERKAELLRRAGAELRRTERFADGDLAGCAVAIGADAPESELRALAMAARAAGIPVNIVDRPELCTFIMPAIVDRDPLTVAVSSGGAAPVLARLLRARIEAVVPPAYGRLAALADSFRAELRRRLPDLAARRRVLERLFTGRAADLVFAGREGEARVAFAAAIAGGTAESGMVFLVGAGPGAADLLTLRALRLLGEADVIVHDHLASAAVVDLARRDSERVSIRPNEQAGALLVRLAQAGKKVVRLHGGDPDEGEAAKLAEAGVVFELVPGVAAIVRSESPG